MLCRTKKDRAFRLYSTKRSRWGKLVHLPAGSILLFLKLRINRNVRISETPYKYYIFLSPKGQKLGLTVFSPNRTLKKNNLLTVEVIN